MTQPGTYCEHRLTRTRIIATVGPACATREALRDLILAGADIFRLNFAHGSHTWLSSIVFMVRSLEEELGRTVALLGDLSGPKIRLGTLPPDGVHCPLGAEFTFVRGREPQAPHELFCTYEPLVDDVRPGDRILLADGTVAMRVLSKDPAAGWARCTVEVAGVIRSKQGVNLPGVVLSTPSLTDKDRSDLAWALKEGIDFIGLSFVRSATDIHQLRDAMSSVPEDDRPAIVAKIEKPEAVTDLEAIVDATDAVMVARGDLGVEVDIVQVPAIQKRIIRLCNQKRVPVITATQMLDSMQRNELPTRAEASDVANAVLDGTDAVMLSGETAAGDYPRQSVVMMSRIIGVAEPLLPDRREVEDRSHHSNQALAVTEAVAIGAVATAEKLNARLIAIGTVSGRAVMAVSKERSRVPVLAICATPRIARRISLLWGVTPMVADRCSLTADDLSSVATEWGRREGVLDSGDAVVIVASSRWTARGHDAMLVHSVP